MSKESYIKSLEINSLWPYNATTASSELTQQKAHHQHVKKSMKLKDTSAVLSVLFALNERVQHSQSKPHFDPKLPLTCEKSKSQIVDIFREANI